MDKKTKKISLQFFLISLIFSLSPVNASADADADNYFQRITNATGTISVSHQAAITTFVESAKAHGYWDNLIDVGPFAGDQLSAALVKLKYATNGSSTLSNIGFVSGDYTPTTGLQGNGTSKYLNTRLNYNTFTSGLIGLSFYTGQPSNSDYRFLIGTTNASSPRLHLYTRGLTSGAHQLQIGGSTTTLTFSGRGNEGFYHGMRQSLTSLKMAVNGLIAATSSAAVDNTTKNADITVFSGNGLFPSPDKGYFYAIDDGGMSDQEIVDYAKDVRVLVKAFGRLAQPAATPLNYVLISGQSLSIGFQGTPALTTTNSLVYNNRMLASGSVAPTNMGTLSPLVEVNNETISSGFANLVSKLTRDANPGDSSQDVVISNWGVAGISYSGLKKSTNPYNNSIISAQNAKSISELYNTSFATPGVLIVHGEGDSVSNTYQSDVEQWQSDYQSDLNVVTGSNNVVPLFHSQPSTWTQSPSVSTAKSPIALLKAHEANPMKTVLVGPKYFLPYADGLHLSNSGYRWLGEYYAKAWYKRVVKGEVYSPLRPEKISRTGNVIDVTFTGNVGNLVLDTTRVSNPGNYGFEYTDASSSASISSVAVTGTSTVQVTLNTVPTGNDKKLRYAFTGTPGTAGGTSTGPRGNLRDSDPTVSPNGYDLFNWTVHFDKGISPVISGLQAMPNTSGAIISWSTEEQTTTQIEYGLTADYTASSTLSTASTTSHAVTLSGLQPATIYHYRIISGDSSGNTFASDDHTFTTSVGLTVEMPRLSAGSSGGASAIPLSLQANSGDTVLPPCCKPIVPTYSFTRNLSFGINNLEVRWLQQFLNAKGFTVSKIGAGSAGKETTFFGAATRAALARFQKANNISPAVGFFGPITRTFMGGMK